MLVVVGLLATVVRQWAIWPGSLDTSGSFWLAAPLIMLGWLAVIALLGGYREQMFGAGVEEYKISSTPPC